MDLTLNRKQDRGWHARRHFLSNFVTLMDFSHFVLYRVRLQLEMSVNDTAVDIDLFKDLNHCKLAKHVFPDPFFGSGHNTHSGRMVCVNAISAIFKENMKLNVQVSFRQWNCTRFAGVAGVVEESVVGDGVSIVRDNISKKNSCTLYCKDCKAIGICCPIAKVSFSGDMDSKVEGDAVRNCVARVDCLYFHNSHSLESNVNCLLLAGCSLLKMSRDFIAGGVYDEAMKEARMILHKGSGIKSKTTSLIENELEQENSYAMFKASAQKAGEWSKRLSKSSWSLLVDPQKHFSNMVRLFYCVSVQLGLSKIASPFDIHFNDQWVMAGSVKNPHHEGFIQEESLIFGGFSNGADIKCQELHLDCGPESVSVFAPSNPTISVNNDASNLFKCGFSMLMSLVEGEERAVYIGQSAGKVVCGCGEVLIVLGNVPQGSVIHSMESTCDKVWPALFSHYDFEAKPRVSVTHIRVPTDLFHSDYRMASNVEDACVLKEVLMNHDWEEKHGTKRKLKDMTI